MTENSFLIIISIASLAFLGSWHCAVMCGPIAIGLSRRGSIFYYHLGRGISYTLAGALCGYLGEMIFRLATWPTRMAGAALLTSFFLVQLFPNQQLEKYGHFIFGKIARHRPGLFIFGLASVFLPCGWLWTFCAAAAASGSPWSGALICGVLWLSSLPALTALPAYFRQSLKEAAPRRVRLVNGILCLAGIYAVWSHFFFH